jgi:hypothetical protein
MDASATPAAIPSIAPTTTRRLTFERAPDESSCAAGDAAIGELAGQLIGPATPASAATVKAPNRAMPTSWACAGEACQPKSRHATAANFINLLDI